MSTDGKEWDGSQDSARDIIAWMLNESGNSCSARVIDEVTKEQAAERSKVTGEKVKPEDGYMILDQVGKDAIRVEVGDVVRPDAHGFYSVV